MAVSSEHLVPINAHGGVTTVQYVSDGTATTLVFGYVPDAVILANESATTGEIMVVFWTHNMGDAAAFNWEVIVDNGTTSSPNIAFASTGASINERDTGATVQTSDPVKVYADLGITIAAGFQDDSDVIHVVAFKGDLIDLGDLGA